MMKRYLVVMMMLAGLLYPVASWSVDGKALTQIDDVTVTGTATLIKAQRLTRTALNCTNTHDTVHVRWGDALVTASSGQQLRAKAAIEIVNSAEVYMISEGASVVISCTEEIK